MSALATPTLTPEATALRATEINLSLILGITITFHVLALLSVFARAYVRLFLVKVLGWDDYTMVAAMVSLVAPP